MSLRAVCLACHRIQAQLRDDETRGFGFVPAHRDKEGSPEHRSWGNSVAARCGLVPRGAEAAPAAARLSGVCSSQRAVRRDVDSSVSVRDAGVARATRLRI